MVFCWLLSLTLGVSIQMLVTATNKGNVCFVQHFWRHGYCSSQGESRGQGGKGGGGGGGGGGDVLNCVDKISW